MVRRHAVVFLVSDFLDEGAESRLAVANRRYDLIAVEITDPRETELPDAGLIEMEDPETGERALVDTSSARVRRTFRERAEAQREKRLRMFRRLGIDSIPLSTDRPYVEPIERFFRMRAKRSGPLVTAGGRR